jgi:hypothetical protein
MAITYELWDVNAGNIIGAFATKEDTLAVVDRLLEAYGQDYAEILDLTFRDDSGSSQVVASGVGIVTMLNGSDARPVGTLTQV